MLKGVCILQTNILYSLHHYYFYKHREKNEFQIQSNGTEAIHKFTYIVHH